MKNFILIFLIIIIYIFIGGKVENVTIPDEAIRFRIIANSDSKEDQKLKMDIALKVEEKLFKFKHPWIFTSLLNFEQ